MLLFWKQKFKVCPYCKQIVFAEKFMDQTYYLVDKQFLVMVSEGEAQLAGCLECLEEHLKGNKKFLTRTEFAHRVIYEFKPHLFERFKETCRFVFKRKGKKHEGTQ